MIIDKVNTSQSKSLKGKMNPEKTIYITTPIYYVNGSPHIGSALTTFPDAS